MKKLSKVQFNDIKSWIYRNARPIELAIWQYEFENGRKEAVLSALSHYQNEDGGFGNALEPDNWNPNSTPYVTLDAIGKLDRINFIEQDHPIMKGIINFLKSGAHCNENGWLFNVPSNNNYPHAPWWTFDAEANEYESIGVSAGISCFVLQFVEKDSMLYKQAFSIVHKLITKLKEPGNYGDMGLDGYCMILEKINLLGLIDQFDMPFFSTTVKRLVDEAIVRDISKWASYSKRPSQFIQSPDSQFYKGNEDIIHREFDYLIETKPENGVWGITWSWFDNNEKYPKEFAISENWWKADMAIRNLKLLRNFGRID